MSRVNLGAKGPVMAEPIALRYTVTPDLLRRAVVAWQHPFDPKKRRWPMRVVVPIMIGGVISAVLAMTGVYDRLGSRVVAGFVVGFVVGFFVMLAFQKYYAAQIAGHAADLVVRQGGTHAVFDDTGIHMENQLGHAFTRWGAVDQVIAMPGATVLRIGAVVYPVPDGALVGGMDGDGFRTRLTAWLAP